MLWQLPASWLIDELEPFARYSPWDTDQVVTSAMAQAALAVPDDGFARRPWGTWSAERQYQAAAHAARIAHLARTWQPSQDDPLSIEITSPDGTWHLADGHHRVHALMLRPDRPLVTVELCGYIDAAEHIFTAPGVRKIAA